MTELPREIMIIAALGEAKRLMPSGFSPLDLQENDKYHDWEFQFVDGLDCDGYYVRQFPLITISINASLSEKEKTMTAAHEVGHHFLHALTGRPGNEEEAEEFARRILTE